MGATALLTSRRYGPLFWTQLSNAFNDNFFKNALAILITFRAVRVGGLAPEQMVAATSALIMLPFFLFSSIGGQLAETMDKARLMRRIKLAEIGIMSVGAVGLVTEHVPLMLFVVFAMGTHSALFGPAKYSILPQLLTEAELVTGNALVESGTYVGVLLGTICGGLLINVDGGATIVATACVAIACAGFVVSTFIPSVSAANTGGRVALNPIPATWQMLRLVYQDRTLWLSSLAISWFWAYGVVLLSLFGPWAKNVLHGDEGLATMFLALFSLGIGLGSLLCERLSRHRLELGLVPLGSIGMTWFTFDLFLVGEPWAAGNHPLDVFAFLATFTGWRVTLDLLLLAVFGGLFSVPLYTLLQVGAAANDRSSVIAGNNVLNALLMVGGAVAVGVGEAFLSLPQVFAVAAVCNGLVALYVYRTLPEFLLRFMTYLLSNVLYRVDVDGLEHVPATGPAVLVCNHVSFVDWLLVAGACKRPARFVMHKSYYDLPVVRHMFDQAKVIPIAGAREDPDAMSEAFKRIAQELDDGQLVMIFPEGRLTTDGEPSPFRPGIERVLARNPVPVVPMSLNGMFGSYFSRKDGQALKKPFRRVWSKVWLRFGPPVPAGDASAAALEQRVREMWAENPAA